MKRKAAYSYIRTVGTAMITKDMTGLNLNERRAVAHHLLIADGYPTRVVEMLTQWFPAQILREHGFTGKAR